MATMYQLGLVGRHIWVAVCSTSVPELDSAVGKPLRHHLMQIGVGLCFTVLYFVIFRFMILKFDLRNPRS